MFENFFDKRGREWEWFVDECYYHMTTVRPVGVRDFNNELSFSFDTSDQAKHFVELLKISS